MSLRSILTPLVDATGIDGQLDVALGIALWKLGPKYQVAPVTLSLWLLTQTGAGLLALSKRGGWAAAGIGTGLFLLIAWCSPTWQVREGDISERQTAIWASLTTPSDGVVHALGLKHPSLRFYCLWPVAYTDDHPAAAQDIQTHPGVVYALRPKVLDELKTKYGVNKYEELGRTTQTVLIRGTK